MTKLNVVIISVLFLTGCAKKERVYYAGPRGGCYYVTDSGEKQYVDSSLCRQAAVAREPEITDFQKRELEVFRQIFVKEFDRVSRCRLLTLDSEFRAGNYFYQGNAICDEKQEDVWANVYNATLPSGKPIKVMESYKLKSKIFIDAENHTVIERVPLR
jgi:hypothetical protein